jgi:hypothetical protein
MGTGAANPVLMVMSSHSPQFTLRRATCCGHAADALDLAGHLGSVGLHGVLEGGVVAFVLVGVGFGEVSDRLVEPGRAAEVGGEGDAVTGAGVRPGQGPSAQAGGYREAPRITLRRAISAAAADATWAAADTLHAAAG